MTVAIIQVAKPNYEKCSRKVGLHYCTIKLEITIISLICDGSCTETCQHIILQTKVCERTSCESSKITGYIRRYGPLWVTFNELKNLYLRSFSLRKYGRIIHLCLVHDTSVVITVFWLTFVKMCWKVVWFYLTWEIYATFGKKCS